MTAASWSIGSLIVAAFIGGYVASRASGLRRKGDGMLHGVVAWAASTLLYAVLASTVLGQASSGVFGALRPLVGTTAASASASELSGEARSEAIRALESAGLNAEQAADIVNQMARSSGDPAILESSSADEAAARIGMATGWMSAAVLLSLVAGALGGLLGNAGQRRKDHVGKLSHGETRVLGRTAF